jgi:UDP-glucose:(heptosyl)LPS alpha-1,3-glucosyltransferase
LKILVVCRPLVFHGGVERATEGLLRGLAEHGDEIELLTPGADPRIRGVRHRTLALPPSPPAVRPWVLVAAVAHARRRGHWDVVQSHERTLTQDVYRAGEGCHRAWLEARARPGRGLYNRVVLSLERRVFARTPKIVAIARAGKAEIERLYGLPASRIHVVYNGVDAGRFGGAAKARAAVRADAGIAPDAHALLFVGSGFERKGLATAIEALARLSTGARLIVVGKGDTSSYRALARRLGVDARIAWLGPRPDVERWYGAANVVVLPTIYEPFGNVHLEALAAGVPIVTTTRAGGAEIVPEACGAVVAPGDAGAVAAAVERLRAMPEATVRDACRAAAAPFTHAAQALALHLVYRSPKAEVP